MRTWQLTGLNGRLKIQCESLLASDVRGFRNISKATARTTMQDAVDEGEEAKPQLPRAGTEHVVIAFLCTGKTAKIFHLDLGRRSWLGIEVLQR